MPQNPEMYADPVLISQYYEDMANRNARSTYASMTGVDESAINRAEAAAYRRQAEMNRLATTASALQVGADVGLYAGASAGVSALGLAGTGVSGFAAGIALPMAAAAVPMAMVGRTLNDYMEKQQKIQSIASSYDSYRGRLGFNSPLSFGQSTGLASSMYNEFNRGGGFFNADQQEMIHDIGISNDLLSAGSTTGGGGSVNQFKENFKKLKETTEEVVKMMKTTITGGMDVIKEMKNMGFGSLDDIRNQVKQTVAMGGMTGVGTHNMHAVGAAGASYAMNVNPYWSSGSGYSMYQAGAGTASHMAAGSVAGSNAVAGVGGVANAGGILARAQMENLQGSIGTRFMSYAMNNDGSIDQDRLGNILSGNVSAYDLVVGSNQRGYNMGPSGRALFSRNKRMALENLTDSQRSRLDQMSFKLWGQGRYGTDEAKAWVFAGQKTRNPRDRELYFQSLMNPRGFDQMYAQNQLVSRGGPLNNLQNQWWGGEALDVAGNFVAGMSESAGYNIVDPIVGGINSSLDAAGGLWGDMIGASGRLFMRDSFVYGNQNIGNRRDALMAGLGISRPMNMAAGQRALSTARAQGGLTPNLGIQTDGMGGQNFALTGALSNFDVNSLSTKEMQNLSSMLTTASYSNPSDLFTKSEDFRAITGLSHGQAMRIANNNPAEAINSLRYSLNNRLGSAPKEYDAAQKRLDQWMSKGDQFLSDKDKQNMLSNARIDAFSGGNLNNYPDAIKNFVKAQSEVMATKEVQESVTRSFKEFDTKSFETKLKTGLHDAFSNVSFSEDSWLRNRNLSDPEEGRNILDELANIERKINQDNRYLPTTSEQQILADTKMFRDSGSFRNLLTLRNREMGVQQAEFYAARTRNSLNELKSSGIQLSTGFKAGLENAYLSSSAGLSMDFIKNNADEMATAFGGTAGAYRKARSVEEAENMMFNNKQAKQDSAERERIIARENTRILANAIISGKETVNLIPIHKGKGEDTDDVPIAENADYERKMMAYNMLSQKPDKTVSDYGKGTVVQAQPNIFNHWNNMWPY